MGLLKLTSGFITLSLISTFILGLNAFADTTATIYGNNVNIRSGNALDSAIVTTANDGQSVTVLSAEGDFYKISFEDNNDVYVSKQFVTISKAVGTVNDDEVNIRKSASKNGQAIGKANKGEQFDVTALEGEWYVINYGGSTAYIHKDFLVGDMIENVKKIQPTITNEQQPTYAIVSSETGLKIRSAPSTDSTVLSVVSQGDILDVSSVDGQWTSVSAYGIEGYVSSEFVTLGTGKKPSSSNDQKSQQVINYAKQFIGTPYSYGGTSLRSGVDCSGFVYAVMGNFGYSIGRSSRDMYNYGEKVSKSDLKAGDLLFFSASGSTITHVAIYIGDGKYIHSTDARGLGVSYASLNDSYSARTYYGARRIIGVID